MFIIIFKKNSYLAFENLSQINKGFKLVTEQKIFNFFVLCRI